MPPPDPMAGAEKFEQTDEALDLGDEARPMIGHNHLKCAGCVEIGDEMERLGDDLLNAREEKRLALALCQEVEDKYRRLRTALSALILENRGG